MLVLHRKLCQRFPAYHAWHQHPHHRHHHWFVFFLAFLMSLYAIAASWETAVKELSMLNALTPTAVHAQIVCTYFVATTGNDANNGTSDTTAFRTIQKAADSVVAGNVVCVRAGTYAGFQVNQKGTAGNTSFIVFKPFPGDTVILNDKGATTTLKVAIIAIGSSHYIEINGFGIADPASKTYLVNGTPYYL